MALQGQDRADENLTLFYSDFNFREFKRDSTLGDPVSLEGFGLAVEAPFFGEGAGELENFDVVERFF